MKVCFFGSYVMDSYGISSGNGGSLLKKIFEKQNVNVIECHEPMKNFSIFFLTYLKLLFKHRKLDYDIMIIPWRGIMTLPLAKLIHRKPIIYFPAFSIYDTLVNDRKKIKKKSLKAKFIHFVDKLACNWSDIVILESTEEIKYFVNEFKLPEKKFCQCPLSADESVFYPHKNEKFEKNNFIVLFFGSFIPLHGIETILKASKILKDQHDIIFKICGEGQTKPEIEQMIEKNTLTNVSLLGLVSKEELLNNISNSDVCLGIFGDSNKASKVLTNKVFQILASKKPLITIKSPASLEAHLVDKDNCILVPPGNPEKLAEAILFLKNNPEKLQIISENGYQNYLNHLSMDVVGKRLIELFKNLIK